jgi:two-component system CheB/CheR fusion protein
VVDRDLRIRSWNERAEDLWGLRPEEVVGRHFLNLDIGLPFEHLHPLLRAATQPDGRTGEVAVPAVNRRGRTITVRVVCAPLRPHRTGPAQGAIVVMETDDGPAGPERFDPAVTGHAGSDERAGRRE